MMTEQIEGARYIMNNHKTLQGVDVDKLCDLALAGIKEKTGADLLQELVALVRGESPRLLNEDSGGDAELSIKIDEYLTPPPGSGKDE